MSKILNPLLLSFFQSSPQSLTVKASQKINQVSASLDLVLPLP